jgi:hypothetical protein
VTVEGTYGHLKRPKQGGGLPHAGVDVLQDGLGAARHDARLCSWWASRSTVAWSIARAPSRIWSNMATDAVAARWRSAAPKIVSIKRLQRCTNLSCHLNMVVTALISDNGLPLLAS